jgi:ubiquinone/menaquinone biosynthesis C-methylase UbiE
MKLNWAEKCVVNNPLRVLEQRVEFGWLKATMPLEQGAKVLEVGCGRGAGAKLIVDAFQPSRLYALDLDIHMVRKAKTYLCPRKHEKVALLVGDALHLPFEDNALDALFGFGVLHHVVNWRGALAEMARVLKIGGTYFMEELYPALYQNVVTKHILFHPSTDRFHSSDLRQELQRANMPIKKAVEYRKLGILAVAVRQ